ncbi:DUF192 domain-containing protein [Patescibacteria group bacterium]|nr:DUF192 domain-containing protein [Patescibacteria group bacterium]
MSNQLKLFLYIVFVVAIFWFIQSRFHIFDVKLGGAQQNTETDTQENIETTSTLTNSVEIVTGANTSVKVNVELADTADERRLGLSFKKYLGDYDGMLFVYNTETNAPFWMKDMQIPIDMIFFDSQGFIVDIKEAQAPCTATYCPSIVSKKSYMYVLEVNSSFVEKNNISEEGSLVLHIESLN